MVRGEDGIELDARSRHRRTTSTAVARDRSSVVASRAPQLPKTGYAPPPRFCSSCAKFAALPQVSDHLLEIFYSSRVNGNGRLHFTLAYISTVLVHSSLRGRGGGPSTCPAHFCQAIRVSHGSPRRCDTRTFPGRREDRARRGIDNSKETAEIGVTSPSWVRGEPRGAGLE